MKKLIAVLLPAILLMGCATNYDTGTGIHPTGGAALTAVQSVHIGMTKAQVIVLIGKPLYANEVTTADGVTQRWGYRDAQFYRFGQAMALAAAAGVAGYSSMPEGAMMILTFSGDRLTSIEKGA
jgi:hypothetical protein